jgi:hypothetical protein
MKRALGTPALFATAYGNVGSSIYYALGLAPLVCVLAGGERFGKSRLIIRA